MSNVFVHFVVWHPYAAMFIWSGWVAVAILPLLSLSMGQVGPVGRKVLGWVRARREKSNPQPWPTVAQTAMTNWERQWRLAGWRKRVPPVGMVGAGVGAVAVAVLIGAGFFGMMGFAALVGLGYWFLGARAARYQAAFVRQLPDGLASLTDTIRTGFSWPQAIVFGAQEFDTPLKETFQALERGFLFQLEPGLALERVATELNIPEWTMVAETIRTQQQLGGNIVPLLQEIAHSIHDRLGVEQEIKTMTAAGRMSGLLIAGLMPIVVIVFWLISPNYLELLFTTALGRLLFALACSLEIIGFVWIREVVRVDY